MHQPADIGIGTSGVHDQGGITDIFGEIPYIFESQFMSVVRPVEQRRIEIPFSKSGEWNPLPITRNKIDRKSTRLNSSHVAISYAVFCLKKKKRHNRLP